MSSLEIHTFDGRPHIEPEGPTTEVDLEKFTDGFRGFVEYDPEKLAKESPDEGVHNANLRALFEHYIKGDSYKDRSTIMVVPAVSNPLCRDEDGLPIIPVPPRVVQSWLSLQTPANQKFTRIMIENAEVSDAYNQAVSLILNDEGLCDWQYLLTVETDNIPPPGGLLQLIQDIEATDLDAVQGLYWSKGHSGSPHCWGKAGEIPRSYRPWVPPPDSISEVNAVSMGFTLFKLKMFREIKPPWFQTVQEWVPGIGERQQTQDMNFANRAASFGYRFGCSTNVRVGHVDSNGIVW